MALFRSRPARLAALASLLWLGVVLAYAQGYGTGGVSPRSLLLPVIALVPPVLFGVIALLVGGRAGPSSSAGLTAGEVEAVVRSVLQPLEPWIEGNSRNLEALGKQVAGLSATIPGLVQKLQADRGAIAGDIARLLSRMSEPEAPAVPEQDQPALPLAQPGQPSAVGPTLADMIRAANFPDNDSDFETVNAIRQALKDRNMAQMLQSAEDVLALMAQDGIYMDDLKPAPGSALHWRSFAEGKRGADVASVGGVHDEAVLLKVKARIRRDQVFRDTALHFQRRFDAVLGDMARNAGDTDLLAFTNTRSGRAFMLLARVSGAFG
jgi:hypothetical protein